MSPIQILQFVNYKTVLPIPFARKLFSVYEFIIWTISFADYIEYEQT